MNSFDLQALENRNKLRLTEEERSFAIDFFNQREADSTALNAVIPLLPPKDPRPSADKDALREDTVSGYPHAQAIVNQAPDTEGGYFKTPKVRA